MRRNIQREWVMMLYEADGLLVVQYEPLRKKEISVRVKRGWKKVE